RALPPGVAPRSAAAEAHVGLDPSSDCVLGAACAGLAATSTESVRGIEAATAIAVLRPFPGSAWPCRCRATRTTSTGWPACRMGVGTRHSEQHRFTADAGESLPASEANQCSYSVKSW